VSEVPERTLSDRLRECQERGMGGIPREELCEYLSQIAKCLDEFARTEKLRHLALMPREIVLSEQGVRLHDFGLAELVWLPGGIAVGSINPRYAAPELVAGQVAGTSDQYSLALIYQEMLTGIHPLRNVGPRAHTPSRASGKPDLSLVPAAD